MAAPDGAVRRRRNLRSEQSIRKLIDAAVAELTRVPYGELTVRSVAARAEVSPTTAYTYFPSKDALIAEIYLRLLREAPVFTDVNQSVQYRVTAQLRELALLIADKPYLADACTTALMGDDAVVNAVRAQIASEIAHRIKASLGPGYPRVFVSTLHMAFSGAMMHARGGEVRYEQIADQLSEVVALILSSSPPVVQESASPKDVQS